ncbi:ATP-dependent helicase [Bacillus phage vB_BceM-HSE3]|nr:ATP-dependent helicase [Bacillus phage vB_BceM-HSE3]
MFSPEESNNSKPKRTTNLKSYDVLRDGGLLSHHIPNYSQRDEQVKLSVTIEDAITRGDTLISEAPTGVGKSLAYLIPSILKGKHVVVSTATKALQDQLWSKDIPLLKEVLKDEIDFNAMMIKGRGNYISLRRFEEWQKEATSLEQMAMHGRINDWLSTTQTGDLEELPFALAPEYRSGIRSDSDDCEGRSCPLFYQCHYQKSRIKAKKAQVLIANHDLVAIDTVLKNNSTASLLPDYEVLVLDEAHQFEDIISKHIGFKLSKFVFRSFGSLAKRVMKYEKEYLDNHLDLKENLLMQIATIESRAGFLFDMFKPDNLKGKTRIKPFKIDENVVAIIRDLVKLMQNLSNDIGNMPIMDEKTESAMENVSTRAEHLEQRLDLLIEMEKYEGHFVFWSEWSDKTEVTSVHAQPITVSQYLKDWLFNRTPMDEIADYKESVADLDSSEEARFLESVILTSATLSTNRSFDFLKSNLGIQDNPVELICNPVFNYQQQSMMYFPPNMPEPSSEEYADALAYYMIELLKRSNGRAFLLFTSYRELDRVYSKIAGMIPYTVLKQGEYPKMELIKRFKEDTHSVLFATSSFWEGVDVQGDALSLVVIDKIPFPVPTDPVVEAKIDQLKAMGNNWFNEYYIPVATIQLVQGFGRLIRTLQDRGVVAFMDPRLISKPYGNRIMHSFPVCYKTQNMNDVGQFFGTMG